MMVHMECRNMWEEILCTCCVYIPGHVRLVLHVNTRCHCLNVLYGRLAIKNIYLKIKSHRERFPQI